MPLPDAVKRYGPLTLLTLILCAALLKGWASGHWSPQPRSIAVLAIACMVVAFANARIFAANRRAAGFARSRGLAADDDPSYVRYVIAFDVVVFTVTGLAAAIAATTEWALALLLSGCCLLVGAFFGLLFGYPQGVAQNPPPPPPPVQLPKPNPAEPQAAVEALAMAAMPAAAAAHAAQGKNLIAESASTLGKLLAGFTLAQARPIAGYLGHLCAVAAPALSQQSPDVGRVLAAVIMLYFFATGFFSGLLLPPYFMREKF